MSETDVGTDEEESGDGAARTERDGAELPGTLTHETWAAALRDGRLLGQACGDCGHVAGTPRVACGHCGSREIATVELPTTGDVYTETTVMVPPEGFEEGGYQVGLVTVGEARVMARFESSVAIGDEVTLSGYLTDDGGDPVPTFEG